MNAGEIKTRLHNEIEHGDERLLKMIYALVKEYNGKNDDDISDLRQTLIMEERERYLKGEGKSHSWDEVKSIINTRQRPDEL